MTKTLGGFIKQHRGSWKKSRRQLALEAGMNHVYLGQIERDEFTPSPAILRKLAKPLHVPLETLMKLAGHLPPDSEKERDDITILASRVRELTPEEQKLVWDVVERFLKNK